MKRLTKPAFARKIGVELESRHRGRVIRHDADNVLYFIGRGDEFQGADLLYPLNDSHIASTSPSWRKAVDEVVAGQREARLALCKDNDSVAANDDIARFYFEGEVVRRGDGYWFQAVDRINL